MVRALVSRSSGPGSSPGRGHCVVFLKTLTAPLSTQVYKWVPADLMLACSRLSVSVDDRKSERATSGISDERYPGEKGRGS